MAGPNDFFINFDSNAPTFASRLHTQLEPARNEIIALGKLLQGLEQQANKSTPAVTEALAKTLPKGGHGTGSAYGLDEIHGAVNDFKADLRSLANELATVVAGVKASTGALGRINSGQGAFHEAPGKSGLVKTADVLAGKYPQAYRMGTLPMDPAIARMLTQVSQGGGLSANSPLAQPSSVRISDLSKIQIDTASIDRVVRAVVEVRDEIRKLGERTLTTTAAPAATGGTAALKTPKAGIATAPATAADPVETQEQELRRTIAELEVQETRLKALLAQAGGAVDETVQTMLDQTTRMASTLKGQLAHLERETTGVTRAEQSARRSADFRRGPDLPAEEYDRRRLMRQRLDLALSPEQFRAQIGRGQGKLSKADLIDMAKQLTDIGFKTSSSKKLTTEQLGEGIISGRQAMLAHFGGDIPEQLQTGRKLVADKVSDAVRHILEQVNITAAEAAEEFAAREGIRQAQMAGHLPKDPTLRGITQLPGSINVPPGMVKGGEYTGAHRITGGVVGTASMDYIEGLQLLRQRALGRAANLAMRPGYDPFRINAHEEIQGGGEEAKAARQAFRALRQATNELDELGSQYEIFAAAIKENEGFIKRATARLEEGTPKPTDPGKLAEAQRNIERLTGLMASEHFKGLQDVFEDPQYQAGRRSREVSRWQYQAQIEDAARREHQTYIGDAAGYAIAGSRLAPGTKDTYIRDIPGLMYQGRRNRFGFTDSQRDPAELATMNQAWWRMQSRQRVERGIGQEVAAGTRPQEDLDAARERTENAATKFLNQMQEIFKISTPLESLIGRAPESARAIQEENRRQGLSAPVIAETTRKLPQRSPEAVLAQREGEVAVVQERLVKAQAEEAAAFARATDLQEQLAGATARLTQAEREQYDAAIAEARAAERRVHQLSREVIQRGNVARGATPEESLFKMGTWQGHWDVNAGGGQTKSIGKYLGDELAAAEREAKSAEERAAAILHADEATVKAAAEQEALAAHLRSEIEKLSATLENRKALASQAREDLRGLSSKVPADSGPSQAAAKQASEALRQLSAEIDRATKDQRRLTELRQQIKAGRAKGEDVSALATERDSIKASDTYVNRTQLKAMRKRYVEEMAAATGGGGVGGPGTPHVGTGGPGGGGGGWEGPATAILRDILTALNGIHRTLQTGVRVTGAGTARAGGVDENGQPRARATNYATREELTQARSEDPRQQALAQAAQRRRLERLKESDIERAYGQAVQENARREREATQERQRSSAITAAAAHADLQLAQAMELIDRAAVQELEKLAQLNREGVTGVKLAEQQARAYRAVNRAMTNRGVEGADRRVYGRTLLSAQGGEQITSEFYNTIARSARGGAGADGARNALAEALFGGGGFWSRILHSTGTFLVRNFTAGFVFGVTNALQEVTRQAIITEQTFVRVSNALEATGKDVGGLRSDLQRISTDYGTSLNDVYDVAAGLVGLFKTPLQIASATRVVAQLETISDGALNAQEAMGVLGSITSSYSDQLGTTTEGFKHVADVLTTIQNVIGTNVEVTAEGVASLSGLSKELNISFEQTAVMVAKIAKQTNQTGAAAGEQFGRILGSMQTGRGQGAISQAFTQATAAGTVQKDQATALTSAFQTGNYGQALTLLMRNWDNLSKSQQRNIAVAVAGQRQMRAFAALMNNTKGTLQDIDKATYQSGSAQDRMNKIMHQLNGQLKILGANFQNLANNLVRSGILDAVAGSLRLVNTALGGINDVLTKINDFVDSNAATRMLKHLTFGILGLVAALKLLAVAKRGIGGALMSREVAETISGQSLVSGGITGGLTRGAPTASATSPGFLATLFGRRGAAQALEGEAEKVALAQRIRNRAAGLRGIGAEAAAAQSLQGASFLRRGEVMGAWGSPFARGAASRGAAALETTANAGAKALEGTATAIEGITGASSALIGPAAAAGVGLLALADNISRTAKVAHDNAQYIDEFNKRYGTNVGQRKGDKDKLQTGWQDFGSKGSATWRLTGDLVSEGARTLVHPSQWGKAFTGGVQGWFGRAVSRDKGTYADNLNQGYGVKDAQTLLDSGLKTLNNVKGGPDALMKAQKDFNDRLGKAAEKIVQDSSLSQSQKSVALHALGQAGDAFAEQTNTLILKAQGLGKADALTTEQIDSANKAIQAMGQLGGTGSVSGISLKPLYDSLKAEVGAPKNSELSGLLDQMSSGTADDLTMGLDTRKVLQDLLNQTQSRLSTMDPSNDKYAGLQQLAAQLGQELLSSTTTLLDTLNQNAQTAAGVLARRGHYGAAAGQYQQGIDQAKADLAAAEGPPALLMGPLGKFMQPSEGQKKKKIAGIKASMDQMYQAQTDMLLEEKLKDLKAQLAVADPEMAKIIQREIDRVTRDFYRQRSKDVPGSVSPDQMNQANQAATNDKYQAAQDKLSKQQAAIATQVAAAGPNNAMAIAKGQLAQAQLAQAAAGKISKSSVEYQQATQQVIAAQYAVISAEGDIAQANANLQAAYANARGDTVGAARAGLSAARAALAYAYKLSGGARSAEVINAQAQVIQARAAVRDARLQDSLDTIDFNLQMGKITQSSAISALKQILRTQNLTKQQRRQLMLQIHGMEKEISDSPWNFGDIKLPKPYLMKRYIEEQRDANTKRLDAMVGGSLRTSTAVSAPMGARQQQYNDNRNVEILINGGNVDHIRKVLREYVGTPTRTRTTAPRRGRR